MVKKRDLKKIDPLRMSRKTHLAIKQMVDLPKHTIDEAGIELDMSPTLRLIIELDRNGDLNRIKRSAKRKKDREKNIQYLLDKIKEYEETGGDKKSLLKLDRKWSKENSKKLYFAGLNLKKMILENKEKIKISPRMSNLLKLDRSGRAIFRTKANTRKEINKIVSAFIKSKQISYLIRDGKLDPRHAINERELKIVAGRFFKTLKNNPIFVNGRFNEKNNRRVKSVILKNGYIFNRYRKQINKVLKKETIREIKRLREEEIKNNFSELMDKTINRKVKRSSSLKFA